MEHIGKHLRRVMAKSRATERGELMKYFCERLNSPRRLEGLPAITMGRMGKMLEKIPTKDLYYLKSVCERAKNFSTKFWYELYPEKYDKKNEHKFGKDGEMHEKAKGQGHRSKK